MEPLPQKLTFRQYRDSDRQMIRRICCETGFLGHPIDPIFRDRELFADLYTNPYLDHEPELTLVVEKDGRVAGYLMGSVSQYFSRHLMFNGFQTSFKMLQRLISGRYSIHPRSEQFVRWIFSKGFKEQPKHPKYAGHLHMNLERPLRRGTVALHMLKIYEDMLKAIAVNHYYIKFFSCRQRNLERFYHRLRFEIYDRVASTIFRPEVSDNSYIVCAHKKLNGAAVPATVMASGLRSYFSRS